MYSLVFGSLLEERQFKTLRRIGYQLRGLNKKIGIYNSSMRFIIPPSLCLLLGMVTSFRKM
jgi:hypothetical protein